MHEAAGDEAEAKRVDEVRIRSAELDEIEQQQREGHVLGEVAVHAHGAPQQRLVAIADPDAETMPQRDGAQGEDHEHEGEDRGVQGNDGRHCGSEAWGPPLYALAPCADWAPSAPRMFCNRRGLRTFAIIIASLAASAARSPAMTTPCQRLAAVAFAIASLCGVPPALAQDKAANPAT